MIPQRSAFVQAAVRARAGILCANWLRGCLQVGSLADATQCLQQKLICLHPCRSSAPSGRSLMPAADIVTAFQVNKPSSGRQVMVAVA